MSTPSNYLNRGRDTARSDEALLLRLGYSQVLYRDRAQEQLAAGQHEALRPQVRQPARPF
jgi:hypothetical protein